MKYLPEADKSKAGDKSKRKAEIIDHYIQRKVLPNGKTCYVLANVDKDPWFKELQLRYRDRSTLMNQQGTTFVISHMGLLVKVLLEFI